MWAYIHAPPRTARNAFFPRPGRFCGFCAASFSLAVSSLALALSARACAFSVRPSCFVLGPPLPGASSAVASCSGPCSPSLGDSFSGSPSRRRRSEGRARSPSCLNFPPLGRLDFGPTWPEVAGAACGSSSKRSREDGPASRSISVPMVKPPFSRTAQYFCVLYSQMSRQNRGGPVGIYLPGAILRVNCKSLSLGFFCPSYSG